MYYQERYVNNVWCFRTSPKGKWFPMSKAQLSQLATRFQRQLIELREY